MKYNFNIEAQSPIYAAHLIKHLTTCQALGEGPGPSVGSTASLCPMTLAVDRGESH